MGVEAACRKSPDLMQGLNVYEGKCTFDGVAKAFGLTYTPASTLL
jgi:alanine dehydrogenase